MKRSHTDVATLQAVECIRDFSFHERLGEGTFGVVKRATFIPSNTTVAIKCIRSSRDEDGYDPSLLREVSFLKTKVAMHPNIVLLHAIVHDEKQNVYMIFEYAPESLKQKLRTAVVSVEDKKRMMKDMLHGIVHLHQHNVVHRDLKPQNALVKRNGTVVIADFGLVRHVTSDRTLTLQVCTLWYRPPELLLGVSAHCPFRVDVWSMACTFAEMASGRALMMGDCEYGQLVEIFLLQGTPAEWPVAAPYWANSNFPAFRSRGFDFVSTEFGSNFPLLLAFMLSYDHRVRPFAQDVLLHPFFAEDSIPPNAEQRSTKVTCKSRTQ